MCTAIPPLLVPVARSQLGPPAALLLPPPLLQPIQTRKLNLEREVLAHVELAASCEAPEHGGDDTHVLHQGGGRQVRHALVLVLWEAVEAVQHVTDDQVHVRLRVADLVLLVHHLNKLLQLQPHHSRGEHQGLRAPTEGPAAAVDVKVHGVLELRGASVPDALAVVVNHLLGGPPREVVRVAIVQVEQVRLFGPPLLMNPLCHFKQLSVEVWLEHQVILRHQDWQVGHAVVVGHTHGHEVVSEVAPLDVSRQEDEADVAAVAQVVHEGGQLGLVQVVTHEHRQGGGPDPHHEAVEDGAGQVTHPQLPVACGDDPVQLHAVDGGIIPVGP
mmetsp:Transcript_9990/g.21340  ORF Transcript_9990/g.21340 Transcript_9990/m.21340 type:complete len:329 (+) Transcript_9990:619-1605(+)